ncbi:MAG: hypothetical protein KGM24_01545 [Elusimicrobia bacterium]|nr:hypothetical protein [Elusimicrobiota bacterium]
MDRLARRLRFLLGVPESLFFGGVAAACALAAVGACLSVVVANPDAMMVPRASVLGPNADPYFILLAVLSACLLVGSLANAAAVSCMARRLEGETPSVRDGIRAILGNPVGLLELWLVSVFGEAVLIFWAEGNLDRDRKRSTASLQEAAALQAAQRTLLSANALLACIMAADRCRLREAVRRARERGDLLARIVVADFFALPLVLGPSLVWSTAWFFLTIDGIIPDSMPQWAFLGAGAIFPAILPVLIAFVLAELGIAQVCASYLAATRDDPALLARIAEYFPETAEAVRAAKAAPPGTAAA